MTTDFDTLLRDTLNGVAERAPDEAGVRAALARRRRPRFALVAVAAAVLLVAVAVPLLRLGGPPGGGPPSRIDPASSRVYPVWLTASWLPRGFGERNRSVAADGNRLSRSWASGGQPREPGSGFALNWYADEGRNTELSRDTLFAIQSQDALIMFAVRGGAGPTAGAAVDLADMGQGRYVVAEGYHLVSWVLDGWRYDVAATGDLDRATLQDFVRGLRNQPSEPFQSEVVFGDGLGGGTPTGYTLTSYLEGVELRAQAKVKPGKDWTVHVWLYPRGDVRPTGEEVIVRGRPAVYTSGAAAIGPPARSVNIDLGDRWLSVSLSGVQDDTVGTETLLRIAEGIVLPEPANDWLDR